ncbi:MAG TPA: hypothetical protein VET48_00425, partial [Steroidobacteraceae bacterium]|nr:hypothetical protein [Steroidobacteraceae bacterium]
MKYWFLSLLAITGVGAAQAQEIDLQQLIRDSQIMRQAGQSIDLVWYIPTEYWRESFRKGGGMPPKQRDEMLGAITDFVMIATLESNVGALGVLSSTPKDELEKKMVLVANNAELHPITEADLPPATKNFIQLTKPLLASMLGQMGEGLHFIMFKGSDDSGKPFVDPRARGRLKVKVGVKEFEFRLPLGSLLPPKMDKESGERF